MGLRGAQDCDEVAHWPNVVWLAHVWTETLRIPHSQTMAGISMSDPAVDAKQDGNGRHPEWAEPRAMAIPPEGFITLERGRYGPTFPRTPACHGFTIIAKIKPGTEEEIRAYGTSLEKAVESDPHVLAPLQLHYLRWVLFPIGQDMYFMYQGIFDTDFDKYVEDAIQLFSSTGITTIFEKLDGFPEDWRTNAPAFIKFVREHQRPSFLEYGQYPFVSASEIKKALTMKEAFSVMLDQYQ
jgi:hypothetical protein